MPKEIKIMIGIALAVLGVGVLLFMNSPAPHVAPEDAGKLVRDNSQMTGAKDAKVVLVEFGDYQCPFCAELEPTIKQVLQEYKDNKDFSFVFRNFPLPQHKNAQVSAEAAESAGGQGRFWEMYEKIYANQKQWSESDNALELFVGYAENLGLNAEQFRSDVQSQKYLDKINTDLDDASALGINSTPTLYLNGTKIQAGDFSYLKNEIDKALNSK